MEVGIGGEEKKERRGTRGGRRKKDQKKNEEEESNNQEQVVNVASITSVRKQTRTCTHRCKQSKDIKNECYCLVTTVNTLVRDV